MIDYVSLKHNMEIPINNFSPMIWKRGKTDDGQYFQWHTIRKVKLRYYEDTHTFTISGKLLRILNDSQVQNMDDVYGARRDLFIEDLNAAVNRLFPSAIVDVRQFTVTRIDYCFNVETPHVKTYVDFLERAFRMTDTGTRENYTSNNDLSGSVYVRTASDYRDNSRKNYTLNFYDKADQLNYLVSEGDYVSDVDHCLAKDILRLEMQCSHQMIKRLTKKFGIGNSFDELLDFKIAYEAIVSGYALVFKGAEYADFYTYAMAKEKLTGQRKAQDVIRIAASHRIVDSRYYYGRSQAMKAGVYPYCFLAKNSSLQSLENPIKLLEKKLINLGIQETL